MGLNIHKVYKFHPNKRRRGCLKWQPLLLFILYSPHPTSRL